MTMWGASDVLTYYGTIVGAAIAVGTLSVTIRFTQKQINREGYLNKETAKWTQIETFIMHALCEINPMPLIKMTVTANREHPKEIIDEFRKYQLECQTVTDNLFSYISKEDYRKVQFLVDRIQKLADQYVKLTRKEIEAFEKYNQVAIREPAQKLSDLKEKCPQLFSVEQINSYAEALRDTEGITHEGIQAEIIQANDEIIREYETTYKSLLQLKVSTFEKIYNEVQEEADSLLLFRRKK